MRQALIVGIDSTIGKELSNTLVKNGWFVYGTSRKRTKQENIYYLNLTKASDFVFENPIDVVYLCAAVTSIKSCEKDSEYSKIINLDAQIILASYFIEKNIHVIYLSSNAVFNGLRQKYKITDKTCPSTAYGHHKEMVEKYLLTFNKISIVRLTKVLTKEYPLILQWIKKLGNNEVISAYSDLYLSPVSVYMVADLLTEVAEKRIYGVVHFSGVEDVTYFKLATYITNSMGVQTSLLQPDFMVDQNSFPRKNPIYASLDITESKNLDSIKEVSYKQIIDDLYSFTDIRAKVLTR